MTGPTKKKLIIYGAIATAATVAIGVLVKTCADDLAEERAAKRRREIDRFRREPGKTPEPQIREPRYVTFSSDPKESRLEDIAMRRVYERCASRHGVFREADTMEGNIVFRGSFPWERVNVFVKVTNTSATDGHSTLPFMITFDGTGAPQTIQATKDIAAKLCGLGASHTDYSL